VLNIGVLSFLLFWLLKERPPTPYCELKPASSEQQQIPLADQRGCAEMLAQLSQLSFSQLIHRLSHTQLIENGYAERDLALACLMAFHYFDLQRALPNNTQPQQKRLLAWKPKGQATTNILAVYPDLTQQQFETLIKFAKTERWPLSAEGLFLLLKDQKGKRAFDAAIPAKKRESAEQGVSSGSLCSSSVAKATNSSQTELAEAPCSTGSRFLAGIAAFDVHLLETFVLTPEFWTVELLFNRAGQRVEKQEILTVLLEGDWTLLKQFVDQQRQVHDSSDARRQKFLLDYVKAGSSSAVILLLKTEWEFAVKKLDDQQVIAILQLMPEEVPEALVFAKEMLISPRSTNVWRQASEWLYTQAGEPVPKQWTHHAALMRFVPEKASIELISKPIIVVTPAVIAPELSLAHAKVARINPINVKPSSKSVPIMAQAIQKQMPSKVLKSEINSPKTTSKQSLVAATKPSVPAVPAQPQVYVVQEGDTLWKIGQRLGVKVDEIKYLNGMKSDVLKKGMVLKLPKQALFHSP